MPTYEYRCDNGHIFEALQSFADDPLTTCEVCEAPVQRVLHSPAVHFKGSGFYTTDYGAQKKQKATDSDSKGSGSSSDSDSSSSSESKSDSGSDSSSSSGSSDKAKASSSSD